MKLLSFLFIVSCTFFAHEKVIASTTSSQDITSSSFSQWLNAAYVAQAVYHSRDDIAAVLTSQGYTINQFHQLDGFLVTYVFATNNKTKHHILAVRGTDNIENIVVDSAFVLVPDKITGADIHQGFLLSAKDMMQRILPDIQPGYKINTIGHSLGGATALVMAMLLDSKGYPIDKVVTFGQPKVTNITGSRKFRHLNLKRLVTQKDIVPLVPPINPMNFMQLSVFWPQGTEVILLHNNQYALTTGIDSAKRALDFLNDVPSEQHIKDHFMSSYISNLKSKLGTVKETKYKTDFNVMDWFGTASPSKP